MKTKSIITLIASLVLSFAAHAEEKKVAGPNGGKIVASVQPHFEFFVTAERKVKITFLTDDNKPTAAAQQTVTATGGDRANPTRFTFVKEGDFLVSDKPLPEGKEIPLVLQIKTTPEAKSVTERINVNLADCSTCAHKEYACTCEH